MAKKPVPTLTVQTLDGSTFYVAQRAITPLPTTFVVTEHPKTDTEITPAQDKEIRQAVQTATTRAGTAKLREGGSDSDLAAAHAEIAVLKAELATLKRAKGTHRP